MSLKQIFKHKRVAAIAGNRHQGKTNNILRIVFDHRIGERAKLKTWLKLSLKARGKTPKPKPLKIYAYGLPCDEATATLMCDLDIIRISSVEQIANKKDCLLILDEFQTLKLNDRRNKDLLIKLMAKIYHPEQNNYILFCSPTTREYNSVIGGYIEVWLLKSMHISDTINGSQLKNALLKYKGHYAQMDYFDIPKDKIILLNDDCEQVITCPYLEQADNKKDIEGLF
jgi:hypothetical protein